MAESAVVAFGRYLRTLRQRRGLSLDDVHGLSRAFPDQIGKHYLSRAENGHLRIAFSKLIALSRIYDVPADVFLERMELDLELERIGGPDTSGAFENLVDLGRQHCARGSYWTAYAYWRDALKDAFGSPTIKNFDDAKEQGLAALMNHTIPVARLGRNRYALFELQYVESIVELPERNRVQLLSLLSQRFRDVGDLAKAGQHADAALVRADANGTVFQRACTRSERAHLARDLNQPDEAIELFQSAFILFRDGDMPHEAAKVLSSLGELYFGSNRLNAAKRSLAAAERLATDHKLDHLAVSVRLLSGRIAEKEQDDAKAVALWRDALERSRKLNDHILRFHAEFYLYKHARSRGDRSTAASLERLLRRRASWLPKTSAELVEFRSLSSGTTPDSDRVANAQRR